MNIESLRDSNQSYREMTQTIINFFLLERDNLTRTIFHCQIIGIMIILGGFSVLVPAYFSEYIILEYMILGIIVIIITSTILLLVEHIIISYSLIDDCVKTCNESITQMQNFRLFITNYDCLELDQYEILHRFQYQIHLSSLVLICEKRLKIAQHWYFFHNKKYRIDEKEQNDKVIKIAREELISINQLILKQIIL